MPTFSFEKIVSTSCDRMFEIFTNYENYEKLVPQHFPSIRIRSSRNDISIVEQHMNFGSKEFIIMAKHVIKKPVLHDIFVIGGDIKGSHIRERFIKVSNGTKVIVDVDLKLKGMMKLDGLFKGNKIKENYAKILDDYIQIAQN